MAGAAAGNWEFGVYVVRQHDLIFIFWLLALEEPAAGTGIRLVNNPNYAFSNVCFYDIIHINDELVTYLCIFVFFTGSNAERSMNMKKYVCNVCGYVYDPAEGDPDNGVAAGTAWEDVPEEWVCPLCSAPKEDFSEE